MNDIDARELDDLRAARSESRRQALPGTWLEGRKLFFDALKHMTTLGTAAVVLPAAIIKDVHAMRAVPWLLAALALMLLATTSSWFVMLGLSGVISSGAQPAVSTARRISGVFVLSVVAFGLGLLGFAVFVALNLLG